VLEAESTPGP